MSVLAMGVNGLRHDADIADATLFDGIHDRGECSKGNIFVGAEVNSLVLGIADGIMKVDGKVIYEAKGLRVGLFIDGAAALAPAPISA